MRAGRIESFNFQPGRVVNNKYEILHMLGHGWEGEVYLTREVDTGIERAAKFFFPQRNISNKTAKNFAKKLFRMRHCDLVVQYLNQEYVIVRGNKVSCLISEYVEGMLLSEFVTNASGKRLTPYMSLVIFYELIKGLEKIHVSGEYHGDLHTGNVMIKQRGIGFQLKLIDPFDWKDSKHLNRKKDIVDAIKILYEMIGGQKHYKNSPESIKSICCGLKTSLISNRFKKAADLRQFIENVSWENG